MEVPLNIIHNYIAAPALLGLGLDILRRYRRNQNRTSLYIGVACLLAFVTVLSFGLPVLFTRDLKILNFWTFVGDVTLAFSMLSLWLLSNQAFLGRWPTAVKIANIFVGLLTIACIIDAVSRTLIPPYEGIVLMETNGRLALTYKDTLTYTILNGLDTIVLFFIAIFFWKQGSSAPDAGQRLRIKAVAVAFSLCAGGFIISPILPVENQFRVSVILWSVAFLIIAIFGAIGQMLTRRARRLTE